MTTTAATAKLLVILASLLFATASLCAAKEWRGIVPLHSSCEDIKRIFNDSQCKSPYDTDEGKVDLRFSVKACVDGWNVPEGTVLSIHLTLNPAKPLAQMGIDLTNFKKEVSDNLYVFYTNNAEGISYSLTPDQKLFRIDFYPAAKDAYLRYPDALSQEGETLGDRGRTYKYDEFGDLTLKDERKRLDDLYTFVKSKPAETYQIYIVTYSGRNARTGAARSRADRIKRYLITARGVDKSRVFTLDGGYRDQLNVELFIKARGGATPIPSPTVCPSEVERKPKKA